MRIAFCYPPIPSEKGVPLLSQNRQFQWFSHPTTIYPVVPASAATLMQAHGHDVLWLDGIVREMSEKEYLNKLVAWQPDVVFLETKTPVVKFHWLWVDKFKKRCPTCKVVMAGDHVSALPDETLNAAPVSAVLKGGDYDFALLSWIEGREIPVDLGTLPIIDRTLTRWKDYAYRNGNFERRPGAYIMSGRDCWYGKCTFCSWTTLYPKFRVRPVNHVLDEIGHLIDIGVREIMDDTGTFPVGQWLTDFCDGMIARGYHRKVRIDCNMRFGVLNKETYQRMRQAGFRMLLFGMESANQSTLDRLCKGTTVKQIAEGAQAASEAGLHVHLAVMFGFPWETKAEAKQTADFARDLLKKGFAKTLQATSLVPYPGTQLFNQHLVQDDLYLYDWNIFDMRSEVFKSEMNQQEIQAFVAYTYRGLLQWQVLIRHALGYLRHPTYLIRGVKSLFGHLRDFRS